MVTYRQNAGTEKHRNKSLCKQNIKAAAHVQCTTNTCNEKENYI